MQTGARLTSQAIPPFKSRPPSRVSIWDEDLTRRLVELCVAGVCYSKIAPEIGVSLDTVSKRTFRVYVLINGDWLRLRDAFPSNLSRPAPVRVGPPPNLDGDAWWTKERVALLKKLWVEGRSGGQIATRLGVTRNAVLGKIHRLGLPGREPRMPVAKIGATSRRPRETRAFHYTEPPVPVLRAIPDLGPAPDEVIHVLNVKESMCRWPIGDPKSPKFRFCGRPRASSSTCYCAHHAAIAYEPKHRERGARPFLLHGWGRRAA